MRVIRPQEGYQMDALSSAADIVIGGGAAGVGKTFSLLLEPLRHKDVKDFDTVMFRRTTVQIRSAGGLWDASEKIYSLIGDATPRESSLSWDFGNKSKIKFSHLEYEKNIYDWQGSEITLLCFDELTHFSMKMFFYLLSRNRSTCGVKPYVRATCNPDPDSWVADFISWWIGEDGYPDMERSGKLRYFTRDGDSFIWGDSMTEVIEKSKYFLDPLIKSSRGTSKYSDFIKSVTFIGGSIYDNQELLKVDPGYLGNLAAQDEDTRLQLLGGNWKVAVSPNDVYEYNAFRDIFENDFVEHGERYITIDVAMDGEDKLLYWIWSGFKIIGVEVVDKSTGKDVIDITKKLQSKFKVRNSNIAFDADGVGLFIGGSGNAFIPGAVAFKNGSKQIDKGDDRTFYNLKTQCYVYSGERVSRGEIHIIEEVAYSMYDSKHTIRQRLQFERKAIKLMVQRDTEPIRLIPKSEMKGKYLNGDSPDLTDALMMREVFELKSKPIRTRRARLIT